jgi:hypothetical protein
MLRMVPLPLRVRRDIAAALNVDWRWLAGLQLRCRPLHAAAMFASALKITRKMTTRSGGAFAGARG